MYLADTLVGLHTHMAGMQMEQAVALGVAKELVRAQVCMAVAMAPWLWAEKLARKRKLVEKEVQVLVQVEVNSQA